MKEKKGFRVFGLGEKIGTTFKDVAGNLFNYIRLIRS
tara:strand:+ start:305 stop:415 length:111 start_codon:yes stop_codon:yes gene_type:complete